MDVEPVTINWVSIENFRGFRAEQTIDLAASATIVSGSNGKGKTSFFDALQWLLLGSVERLVSLASRRSGEYLVNGFAGPGAVARVSAELMIGGRTVALTRSGNQRNAPLRWVDAERTLTAEEADTALCRALLGDPEMSLKDIVLTSGLLEQDVVRAVLEDEPKSRYRHMAALLGLEEIAGFEDEAERQADEQSKFAARARDAHTIAEQRLRSAEKDLARLEQRIATQPEIAQARVQLELQLAETAGGLEISQLPTQATDAVSLGQLARRLRGTADDLLSRGVELGEQEAKLPAADAGQLAAIQARKAQAEQEHAEAEVVLEAALARQQDAEQLASHIAELAARAIPMLSDHCPVCEQSIDPRDVEIHLRELIDAGGQDLPALATATAAAQQEVETLGENLRQLRTQLDDLQSALRQIEEVVAARARWRQDCEALASDPGSCAGWRTRDARDRRPRGAHSAAQLCGPPRVSN
jgi:DNA repair exonuclease SbcCD ATPase subunit